MLYGGQQAIADAVELAELLCDAARADTAPTIPARFSPPAWWHRWARRTVAVAVVAMAASVSWAGNVDTVERVIYNLHTGL